MENEIISTVTPAIETVIKGGDIPTWFVVAMGMGIVFIGLISLIILITLMGKIMGATVKKEKQETPAAVSAPIAAASAAQEIPNRGELVAAISVALAEELGKDVRAIRILSIKKV